LPAIRSRHLDQAEILFRAGDPGDALYIVARAGVEVLADGPAATQGPEEVIAQLGEGHAFGEMPLLTGHPRTATIRAVEDTDLLEIGKEDFERITLADRQLARAVERLSHERAVTNLAAHAANPTRWAQVAASSLYRVTRDEADRVLAETGKGAGLAIVFGNTCPLPGVLDRKPTVTRKIVQVGRYVIARPVASLGALKSDRAEQLSKIRSFSLAMIARMSDPFGRFLIRNIIGLASG
jgi:CRP-like cAMP-binding protein